MNKANILLQEPMFVFPAELMNALFSGSQLFQVSGCRERSTTTSSEPRADLSCHVVQVLWYEMV